MTATASKREKPSKKKAKPPAKGTGAPARSQSVEYPGRPPRPWGFYVLLLVTVALFAVYRTMGDDLLFRLRVFIIDRNQTLSENDVQALMGTGEKGIAALERFLKEFPTAERANLIGHLGQQEGARPLVEMALRDEAASVRRAALRVILAERGAGWEDQLAPFAESERVGERILARTALIRSNSEAGRELARFILNEPAPEDPREQRRHIVWFNEAARALMRSDPEAALPVLMDRARNGLTGDTGGTGEGLSLAPMPIIEAAARLEAIDMIGQAGVTTDEVKTLLEEQYLEPPRPYIRITAERAMVNLGLNVPDLGKYLERKRRREVMRRLRQQDAGEMGVALPGGEPAAPPVPVPTDTSPVEKAPAAVDPFAQPDEGLD